MGKCIFRVTFAQLHHSTMEFSATVDIELAETAAMNYCKNKVKGLVKLRGSVLQAIIPLTTITFKGLILLVQVIIARFR